MEPDSLVGGVAAILVAATLLAGAAGLATHRQRGRPWLIVLVGLNAGRADVSQDTLRAIPPVDVLLLGLSGVAYAGFWPGPGANHAIWMTLAIAQPLLGIAVLVVTRLWGRSGLMGGGLVLSILMLLDGDWTAGWLGTTTNLLLLVGDLGTTGSPRRPLALALATGYGTLVLWFGVIAVLLLV